ncbi:MAG: ATP-dependent Clp protease adapter ClpS [Microcella sp.]
MSSSASTTAPAAVVRAQAPRGEAGRDAGEQTGTLLVEQPLHAADVPWQVVVWNDPVNLMSYVAWVFRRHFGLDAPTAEQRMMQVHTDGRATLADGNREVMERHAEAMHEYGLWATVERAPR